MTLRETDPLRHRGLHPVISRKERGAMAGV